MANYWLHRISHEWDVSKALFDKNLLTVGWGSLTGSGVLELAKGNDEAMFEKIMAANNADGRSRWSLYRFLRIQPGDVVVVPLYEGTFAIADVVEGAKEISDLPLDSFLSLNGSPICCSGHLVNTYPQDTREIDLGFFIKIDNLKMLPRAYALPKLQSRMKMRQTNAQIDDLQQEVDAAKTAVGPVNLHDKIMESVAASVLYSIQKNVSPTKFETLVRWYMERIGASKTYIPSKNEHGKHDGADADVIAEFDPMGIVIYIQAKKHDTETKTSDWAVEQISKYKEQKECVEDDITYIPWVITTARFSEKAVGMAKESGVRLIDGTKFATMLVDAGVSDINEVLS